MTLVLRHASTRREQPLDARPGMNEEEVVYVVGRHRPAGGPIRARAPQERRLVALDVELGERPKAVGEDGVPRVSKAAEVLEGRVRIRSGMALLDLDEERRQSLAQRRLGTAKNGELVTLHVALHERDALETERIQALEANADRGHAVRSTARRGNAREAVEPLAGDDGNVQDGVAGLVGETDAVDSHVRAGETAKRRRMLRIRLEHVHVPCRPDEPREEPRVDAPTCARIDDDGAWANELLHKAKREVALTPVAEDREARAQSRADRPGDPNRCANRVDPATLAPVR